MEDGGSAFCFPWREEEVEREEEMEREEEIEREEEVEREEERSRERRERLDYIIRSTLDLPVTSRAMTSNIKL